MAIIRVERSDDPAYLCSRHGPRLARAREDDFADAVIVVHASEMDAELATAFADAATRVSEGRTVRLGQDANDPPAYDVITFLLPVDEIPHGRFAHIEKRDTEVIVMYDETRITPDLAARLAAMTTGPGTTARYNGHGST